LGTKIRTLVFEIESTITILRKLMLLDEVAVWLKNID